MIRRYVLQAQLQSATHEIDNERPIRIAVTISSNNGHTRADRAHLVENALSANIAQVPDFIGALSHFAQCLRQTVMRVGEHENAPRFH